MERPPLSTLLVVSVATYMGDSSENSLCDVSIRHSGGGRNPVSGLCWPLSFSCLVVSVATNMGDCYENDRYNPLIVIPAKERNPLSRRGRGLG